MSVIPLFTDEPSPRHGRRRAGGEPADSPAGQPAGRPGGGQPAGRAADRPGGRGGPPPPPCALALVQQARDGLATAVAAEDAAERYAGAHLAALRGAAAVVAVRAR